MKNYVDVLGTRYRISRREYAKDATLRENEWSGYCDKLQRLIVVAKAETLPGMENGNEKVWRLEERRTLRHEIVHAFLNESGLQSSAFAPRFAWPDNEELVDWIALQGPKAYAAWWKAGCLDDE